MLYIPSKRIIEYRLDSALLHLIDTDRYLLDENLHERTIVHKFASYLQFMFRSWHVDVEYNNNMGDTKRLNNYLGKRRPVFPDIIIHRRGNNDNNLLAIEAKALQNPSQKSIARDRIKLQGYKEQLDYHYACFILFIVKNPLNPKPYQLKWI
ncbi:MAG: hypothetical protein LCH85_10430 [Chloroflexi bacterium]|nr:hypothetical protein [Chloroflexota bacterium]